VNLIKSKGFTIIEAIVSLALFAIAFSGLYFFFGMAHQAYNNSEKRMHLNLMANHILDTIHAEASRSDADVANPFVTPASYNANLSDCATYTAPDVRHTWCTELNASVGPHKGVHADEVRTVEVVKDEAYLIADVTLVVDAGIGEKNLIKTFLSRKIAAPRRSTPPEACVERHNEAVAYIKSQGEACYAGTISSLKASRLMTWPSNRLYTSEISCPSGSSKNWPITAHFHSFLVGRNVMSSYGVGYLVELFGNHITDTYRNYSDRASFLSENTIYGEGYPWTGGMYNEPDGGRAGIIGLAGYDAWDRNFCRGIGEYSVGWHNEPDTGTITLFELITAGNTMYRPKAICHNGRGGSPPIMNVISCCPGETDLKSDGTYKTCSKQPQKDPSNLVHFMVEGVDYSKIEGFSYYDYPGSGWSTRSINDGYNGGGSQQFEFPK